MTASRTSKTLQNARVGALCYLLSLFVSFFSRRIFLDHLGAEFLGYTGTVGSILGFLNIAELGISGAVSMVLYKPLFDQNQRQISEIISLLGYLYRFVGLFIGGAGVLVSFFLPWIFPSAPCSLALLFLGYYAYLFAALLGYFVNYHAVLLSADQRNYIVSGYYQAAYTLKVFLQCLVALVWADIALFFLLEVSFGLVYAVILRVRIRQYYPWLQADASQGRALAPAYPQLIHKVRQVFAHRIGGFVQFQSTSLFVYAFVSLPMVALYGNYMLVSGSLRTFLQNVLNSMSASIGNLVAEGKPEHALSVYFELLSFRFCIAGIFSACLYWLLSDFITLWLGPQYLLSSWVVLLISIQLFLSVAREATEDFLNAYGLVQDVWSPAVESVVFVSASLLFGYLWGLEGVLLGPIISLLLVIYTWKPYFLFTRGFHHSLVTYCCHTLLYLLLLGLALLLTYQVFHQLSIYGLTFITSWAGWLLKSLCHFSLITLFTLLLFFLFLPEFRHFLRRFRHLNS